MNKLLQGESSRIVTVLDESLLFVELLRHIPEKDQLDSLIAEVESGGHRAVKESLEALRDSERRFVKAMRGTNRDHIDMTTAVMNEMTRQVCRCFRQNPKAIEVLIQWSEENARRQAQERLLEEEKSSHDVPETKGNEGKDEGEDVSDEVRRQTQYFFRLHTTLAAFKEATIERLNTTVEQKAAKAEFFDDIKVRIKQQEEELERIKAELDVEATKEKELEEKKSTISKLSGAIQEVLGGYDKDMSNIQARGEEEKVSIDRGFQQHHSNALKNFDKASEEYIKFFIENSEREDSLRKKMNRNKVELNQVIAKYDREMIRVRRQFDRLFRTYKSEASRLAVLEEHFRKIDRDLANEAEEERLIQEELAKIRAAEKYKDDAAALIQALYRGNKCRKMLKKKKKGKKGKGKGKKGKKK